MTSARSASLVGKTLRIAAAVLLLLVVLLGAAAGYLLATQSGARFLWDQATRQLPGTLSAASLEGTLTGPLVLKGFVYQQPDLRVSAARLRLDWSPRALLDATLHLHYLELEALNVQLAAPTTDAQTDDQPESSPLPLGDLALPLALRLDRVYLHQTRIEQKAGQKTDQAPSDAEPILIEEALLKARTENSRLQLQTLFLKAPQGELRLDGDLDARGDYPLALNTSWRVKLADAKYLAGKGEIGGSLSQLDIQQTLSEAAAAQINAKITNPLADLGWQLQARKIDLPLELLQPERSGQSLKGQLDSSGDLARYQLSGDFNTRLPELGPVALKLGLSGSASDIDIQRMALTLPASDGRLNLAGRVRQLDATPTVDLTGSWRNLGYPLVGKPEYQSPSGEFTLKGGLNDYRVRLSTELSGAQIPAGRWQLNAKGNDKRLREIDLKSQVLEGSLAARGEFAWAPSLAWQFQLEGQQLNPGAHWAEWPGRITFAAGVTGSLPDQKLQAKVDLQNLEGTLREQPLGGQAKFNVAGEVLEIEQLNLDLPGAQLQAKGRLAEQVDLQWRLNAKDLAQLLPGGQGRLTGEGELSGTQAEPRIRADLVGDALGYQQQSLDKLKANIDLDWSGKRASRVRIEARNLRAAQQRWQRLDLTGTGTPQQHKLALKLQGDPAALAIDLAGGWQAPLWRGHLERADLQPLQLGQWRLTDSVALEGGAESGALEQACWRHEGSAARLCVAGSRSKTGVLRGNFETAQLPLSLLSPWIPPGMVLDGELNARGEVKQRATGFPEIQAQAAMEGGQIELQDQNITIAVDAARLELQGSDNRLHSQLTVQLEQAVGGMNAKLDVTELTTTPKLAGNVEMELKDLQFLSGVSPHLQAIQGQLLGQLQVRGAATQPEIQGHLHLAQGSAEVPALGLKLQEIDMKVSDRAGQADLQVTANLRSGDGRLSLDGHFDPQQHTGAVTLRGDRFQAIATQEVQAWISPDLELKASRQRISLNGEIRIPEALISPPKTQSVVGVSPDVVIVEEQESEASNAQKATQPLDAKVRITLGDKVQVKALGFEGRLEGSILVEEDSRQATRASGNINVASGEYQLYGQDFTIERGNLVYSGGPVENPGLDMRIVRKVEEVKAGARIGGTAQEPQITLFSEPAMPESSLLSYLLLGRAPGSESPTPSEQELLMRAASALTLKGGNKLAEKISSNFKLDEFGFEGGETATDASLFIGKYLSPKLYVKYGMGLFEPTNTFFMRYKLSKKWSLESETGTTSSGADLIFTHER